MVHLRPRHLASLALEKLGTGCPQLDHALGGGLPAGSITELAGEAAASKTQLCLQLLLSVQLPHEHGGLEGSAVYVYTEGEPAMRRLQQLSRLLPLRYPPEALAGLPDPAANIFIEKSIDSGQALLARLQRLRSLLERQARAARQAASAGGNAGTAGATGSGISSSGCSRRVRLLVVDSVAHVFRDMGDSVGVGELTGRTELLFRISALLRRYADEFGLVVLLVNQVVDSVGPSRSSSSGMALAAAPSAPRHAAITGGLRLVSLGREVAPALGLAWANCVNTRLFLSRCGGPDGATPALFHGAPSPPALQAAAAGEAGAAGAQAPALRKLQVLFSPHLPQAECFYVVEATGVRGLHPTELEQHDAAAAAAAAAAWREQQAREQQQRQEWEAAQRRQAWEQQQARGQAPQGQQGQQARSGGGPWEQGQQQTGPWQQQGMPGPQGGRQQQQQPGPWQQQQQQQQGWAQHQQQQQWPGAPPACAPAGGGGQGRAAGSGWKQQQPAAGLRQPLQQQHVQQGGW